MLGREKIYSFKAASVTEGSRRLTEVTDAGHPDPEVPIRPRRRYLTITYKLKVLKKVSELNAQGNGQVGAYLRSEGLYYSSVNQWQKQLENGILTTKRGKREKNRETLQNEIRRLKRKLEQTEKKLKKTEMMVELQKKISEIMGIETEKDT